MKVSLTPFVFFRYSESDLLLVVAKWLGIEINPVFRFLLHSFSVGEIVAQLGFFSCLLRVCARESEWVGCVSRWVFEREN